jgi:hypothetical protein
LRADTLSLRGGPHFAAPSFMTFHAEKGLIDEYEVYLNSLVWGEGNVHALGDRGTIRLELADVKRFESGVVLLTYRPAS